MSINMAKKIDQKQQAVDRAVEKFRPFWAELDNDAAQLAANITEAVEWVGGRKAAAEVMQVNATSIDNYRAGRTQPKSLEYMRLLAARAKDVAGAFDAEKLGLVKQLEASRTSVAKALAAEPAGERVSIPRYAVQASAGDGAATIAEDVADYMIVSRSWLSSIAPAGARLGIVEGRGDSMADTIQDGDLLIVSFDVTREDINAGGVFVFTYEGDVFLKRLALDLNDGSVEVISDNPAYRTQTISREMADEKMHVHAKVLRAIAPLRQHLQR
ncbi:MAG: S24 family peptidase [Phyllobacteriaceae bacterium]|nr:S24 family peptidase [Phyllobacteriaceae bacterium]